MATPIRELPRIVPGYGWVLLGAPGGVEGDADEKDDDAKHENSDDGFHS